MPNWIIGQEIDLQCGAAAPQVWPNALMVYGDNQAHTWRVAVKDNGSAADLTGCNVVGYFVRADGYTVAVQGTISGDVVAIVMASTCYAIAGELRGILRLSKGNATTTLSALIFRVRKELTDAIIDPGSAIPTLDALLAQIAACETATANATTATSNANTAEAQRASAETSRVNAETGRVNAEKARATAESGRAAAETTRVNAENARASAETARASTETARVNAENARTSAETGRASAETARVNAENARASAETARASAETVREAAEAQRRTALNGLSFTVGADGGLDITYTYTATE